MLIEMIKNKDSLIFRRPSKFYFRNIVLLVVVSVCLLSVFTFNISGMFNIKFSSWHIVSFLQLLVFPVIIFTFLYVYVRDITIGYLLKFDLLSKKILRNKKVLVVFEEVDYLLVNRKINIYNEVQNNIFFIFKNGKKESILFYDNEKELMEAVNEIKNLLNIEVKEE